MDKRIEARNILTNMYESFLVINFNTYGLDDRTKSALVEHINKILKECIGEERCEETDFGLSHVHSTCIRSKDDWESLLASWLR